MMTTDIQTALTRLREAITAERPRLSAALFPTAEQKATDDAFAGLERLLAVAPAPALVEATPLFKAGDKVRLKPGASHGRLGPDDVATVISGIVYHGQISVDAAGASVEVFQRALEMVDELQAKRDEVLTLGRLESLLLRAESMDGPSAGVGALLEATQRELQ